MWLWHTRLSDSMFSSANCHSNIFMLTVFFCPVLCLHPCTSINLNTCTFYSQVSDVCFLCRTLWEIVHKWILATIKCPKSFRYLDVYRILTVLYVQLHINTINENVVLSNVFIQNKLFFTIFSLSLTASAEVPKVGSVLPGKALTEPTS